MYESSYTYTVSSCVWAVPVRARIVLLRIGIHYACNDSYKGRGIPRRIRGVMHIETVPIRIGIFGRDKSNGWLHGGACIKYPVLPDHRVANRPSLHLPNPISRHAADKCGGHMWSPRGTTSVTLTTPGCPVDRDVPPDRMRRAFIFYPFLFGLPIPLSFSPAIFRPAC